MNSWRTAIVPSPEQWCSCSCKCRLSSQYPAVKCLLLNLNWPHRNSCLVTYTHEHTQRHEWWSSPPASVSIPASWQEFKNKYSLISLDLDSSWFYKFQMRFGSTQPFPILPISQWPSALGSSCRRREDSYLADDTLRALGRALSWKDLFSLEIGSAFPAIIWSSWELVLLNTLPAWWEHMDFYSGLGIITNQTCDFGQIIWPLLHLSLLICLLGQLPLVCFIRWISVRIKLWYLEIVNSEFIVRWYLYFVFHFFFPPSSGLIIEWSLCA